ncbi:MAG: NAD(P)H-hydrate dehydratase [Clostridium sp.]|nr:NAD(P)H-hydrate dehydratase [Acetatifactor muris]MCM1527853.1 NAD(P)H-hydrate dehydratase [Bacteroides sp.]MCM1563353.1 NAD(P)H-hydrate dehydratase [Clostridium sp.]
MKYVVTAEEMRRYDTDTMERIGIPGMTLMERAALAARDAALKALRRQDPSQTDGKYRGSAWILAGMGNNGGDGLALARLLAEAGLSVDIRCVGDASKASEQWTQQRHILEHYRVRFCDAPVLREYTVLIDALFGVGLSREVTGIYADAIREFNELSGYKLALDIPSGISSDTGAVLGQAVRADATVTFGFIKRGLILYPGCGYAGTVQVADIGITERSFRGRKPEMFCISDARDAADWIPPRPAAGNKGTFGKVLLVAGGRGMAGAAILGAQAAYRAGAGMVKVLTDESNRIAVQTAVPEALYGTWEELLESADWADVIAIGPGLGRGEDAYACLERVLTQTRKPLLIDADGLNLLAESNKMQEILAARESGVILTPHVGELSQLTGLSVLRLKEDLWRYGTALAHKLHAVVAAKDARTFVCGEESPVYVNTSGNDGMATAGSGDVLTGLIAGLWAQRIAGEGTGEDAEENRASGNQIADVFAAACAGVWLHGAAGDAAARERGRHGCMAGDLADAAAMTLRDVERCKV